MPPAEGLRLAEGVPGVPTVTVGDRHSWGDVRLEEAAGYAAAAAPSG
jgi:hypothetical protein